MRLHQRETRSTAHLPIAEETDRDDRRLRLPKTLAALRIRNYRVVFFGMLASMTAMQMRQIARGYLAFELAGKVAAVGLVSAAGRPMRASMG